MKTMKKQAVSVAVAVALGMLANFSHAYSEEYFGYTDNKFYSGSEKEGKTLATENFQGTWTGQESDGQASSIDTLFGGYSEYGSVFDNTVTLTGGTIKDSIYGGYVEMAEGGSANNNIVNISNSANIVATSSRIRIAGGYTASTSNQISRKSVSGNKVIIDGGQFTVGNKAINVYGGISRDEENELSTADANNNIVEIKSININPNGASLTTVYGGMAEKGDANENRVTVSDGYIDEVYGGASISGSVKSNLVELNGSMAAQVAGGRSYYGDADSNTVKMNEAEVEYIIGGFSTEGSTTYNAVSVNGGTIYGSVYGGYCVAVSDSPMVKSGSASHNSVTVNGGTNQGAFYGGYSFAQSDHALGTSKSGDVNSNTVTVSGNVEVKNIFGGATKSQGGSSGRAVSNTVTILGTVTTATGIYGGFSSTKNNDSGDVEDNTVIISGTVTCDEITGGSSFVPLESGSSGSSGAAVRNRVIVSGVATGQVVGGRSLAPDDSGGAMSNTVVVSGSVVGMVTGGDSYSDEAGAFDADNNAVIWQGSISTAVAGGCWNGEAYGTTNTLAVVGSNKTTGTVLGFQRYIFLLDDGVVVRKGAALDSSNAMLTTTSDDVDVSGVQIGVGLKAGSSTLQKGDKAILVNSLAASNTTVAPAVDTSAITSELARNGNDFAGQTIASLESKVNKYEFALSIDTIESKHCLVAEVANVAPNAVTTDVRQIASSNYVNFRSQMSDVTQRMGELRTSNKDGAWARLYGGKYTLGTGMKEKSITLQIGADRWFDANSYVGLTAAYTKADDTLTSGDNKQKNWNVGFYGGYVADSGLFVDAIVKHGQIKNDFSLRYESGEPSTGKYHTYGTSASIEGGWRFNCPTTAHYLEPQVELAYGHLQSVTFNAGEVEFQQDAVNSLVGRIGVAAGYKFAEDQGNLYLRTSLLYDFKGEVKTRATAGAETDGGSSRDLGGTWGEFVLGGNYKATKNLNLYGEMMCSTKAAGVRTKWQGSIGARWTF